MTRCGYVYDGSSTWSIGPEEDPQVDSWFTVYDRNGERAIALARVICEALNDGRLVFHPRWAPKAKEQQ